MRIDNNINKKHDRREAKKQQQMSFLFLREEVKKKEVVFTYMSQRYEHTITTKPIVKIKLCFSIAEPPNKPRNQVTHNTQNERRREERRKKTATRKQHSSC